MNKIWIQENGSNSVLEYAPTSDSTTCFDSIRKFWNNPNIEYPSSDNDSVFSRFSHWHIDADHETDTPTNGTETLLTNPYWRWTETNRLNAR